MPDASARSRPHDKIKLIGAAVLVVLVGTCAYANSFRAPIIFDGVIKILENPAVRGVWPPWNWLLYDTRPVAYLSFAIDYSLYGLKPLGDGSGQIDTWGWHASSLMIHLAAGLTLLGVAHATLSRGRLAERYAASALPLALGIALIWVAHPLQTQSVTYVIQRIESLMGLFYLLTLAAFIVAQWSARPNLWYAVSLVACALGMATKEVMVTAPLLVLCYDRIFVAESWRQIANSRKWYYLLLFGTWALLAFLVAARWSTYSDRAGVVIGLSPLQYAVSQPGVITHYLRLCFVPAGQCLDYGWPVATTFGEIVPPALLIAMLLASTVWCLFRYPAAGFLGLWFFVILSPTSTIMPIQDLAFEHRMYLPLAAVVAGFVVGGFELTRTILGWNPRGWLYGVIPAIVCVCVLLTYLRNETYRTEALIWADVISKAPENPRGYLNYGLAMYMANKPLDAINSYHEAIRVGENYDQLSTVYSNLGIVYQKLGDMPQAMENYARAIDIDPNDPKPHANLGIALVLQGRAEEALQEFEIALEIRPLNADFHTNIGQTLKQLERQDEAIEHFQRALDLDPNNNRARSNLDSLGVRH